MIEITKVIEIQWYTFFTNVNTFVDCWVTYLSDSGRVTDHFRFFNYVPQHKFCRYPIWIFQYFISNGIEGRVIDRDIIPMAQYINDFYSETLINQGYVN